MNTNQRMSMILAATPGVLAKIDAVLAGDETHVPKKDPECRTCTLTEAARRLGVSRPTIYRLIQRGALKAVALNGVSRVVLQSLFDYVSNNERVNGNLESED